MKKFLRFIFSRVFIVNVLLALGISAVLFLLVTIGLKIYTQHGKAFTVPELIGLNPTEVDDILKQLDLRYEIIDSTFTDEVPLGTIAEQYPKAESKVKKGRKIYLVKNAELPEMVAIPMVVDLSLRRARSTLEAYGFSVGKLEYMPDIGVNVVLKMKYKGNILKRGEQLVKGSSIDLVVGQGLSDEKTFVPNISGLPIDAAITLLNDKFLNIGAVTYDVTVKNQKDSMDAKIFRQVPAFDTVMNVNLGKSVDVWLSVDTNLIPKYIPDSILMDSLFGKRDTIPTNLKIDE
jgi:eukaryotic-like serine/threonine-protein kinase